MRGAVHGVDKLAEDPLRLRFCDGRYAVKLLGPVVTPPEEAVREAVLGVIVPVQPLAIDLGDCAADDGTLGEVKLEGPIMPSSPVALGKDERRVIEAEEAQSAADMLVCGEEWCHSQNHLHAGLASILGKVGLRNAGLAKVIPLALRAGHEEEDAERKG